MDSRVKRQKAVVLAQKGFLSWNPHRYDVLVVLLSQAKRSESGYYEPYTVGSSDFRQKINGFRIAVELRC
jgi:hypothetical protein